jgi:glycosyltransferase involved in cell wall biosynthesis
MKVALISSRYSPDGIGGAEKVVQLLAEGLVEQGHEANVLTLSKDSKPRKDMIQGVHVDRFPTRNIYPPEKQHRSNLVKAVWHTWDTDNHCAAYDVKKWIQKVQPDIVNTHVIAGFSTSIWKVVKLLGIPLIHTVHDQYLLCPRTTMFRGGHICQKQCLSCKIYSIPKIKSTSYIDKVVGVSQFILDHHRKYDAFAHNRQVIIYNGMRLSRESATQENCLPKDKPIVRFGFLGKIIESKGIRLLIEAFLQLEPRFAELWIAGRGLENYEIKLKSLTKIRDEIRWLGFVNPKDLFSNIDVLIVPSIWNDTAPLVIHEAFSFGIPVIGSKLGGITELVTPEVGWLFDPYQPETLVELLREVIRNKETIPSLGSNALKNAELFTRERMVSAYLNEYEQLLQMRSIGQ